MREIVLYMHVHALGAIVIVQPCVTALFTSTSAPTAACAYAAQEVNAG